MQFVLDFILNYIFIYVRCEVTDLMGHKLSHIVDEDQCADEPKPSRTQPCHMACEGECVVSDWSEWTSCDQVSLVCRSYWLATIKMVLLLIYQLHRRKFVCKYVHLTGRLSGWGTLGMSHKIS